MTVEIKALKSFDSHKKGDIFTATKKASEELVKRGYAEYVKNPKTKASKEETKTIEEERLTMTEKDIHIVFFKNMYTKDKVTGEREKWFKNEKYPIGVAKNTEYEGKLDELVQNNEALYTDSWGAELVDLNRKAKEKKKIEVIPDKETAIKENKNLAELRKEITKEEPPKGITLNWVKHDIKKWVWAYYNKGLNLLPIKYKTKEPNGLNKGEIKKWQYERQSKELIQKWVDKGLFEGIAILGGKVSCNIICLDFDDPEIFKILGLTVEGLINDGAWVTETPKERGRYHIVIRDINEVNVTRKQKFIDYRANEHYWVAHPSIHPNGKQYNFLNTHNPDELQLPASRNTLALFEKWNDVISQKRGTKEKIIATIKTKCDFDKSPDCIRNAFTIGAPPGMRYYIAIALGSWLQQHGFPEEMAKSIVVEWFKTKCDITGRPIKDIENAVATAYTEFKDEDGKIKTYQTGCNFWREKTNFCPYPDKKDCKFKPAEIKGKNELLEKYEAIIYNPKTGAPISVNCPRLADIILNEHNYYFFTMRDNQSIFFYDGGHYEPKGESIISNLVEYYLDDLSTEHRKNETVGHIRDKNYVDRDTIEPDVNLINLENGAYNIETREILPHSPKYRFLNKIPIKYEPDARCPLFEKFLQEVCMKQKKRREDIEKTIQEYLGYTLYRSYPFKRYLVLDGSGDNGKTVLLTIGEALVGKKNNASVSLHDLNNRPFALSKLYGKLANISDDLPNRPLKYTGIIKQITGNSPMWADIKNHKDGIRFTNTAKPWFACNQLPESYDWTDAFFSRMLQITFLNKFVQPPDYDKINDETVFKADTDLIDGKCKLFGELPGILNFALEGLHRLLENKRFSFTQSTDEVRDEYIKKTNPIHAFIDDECERTNEDWGITKDDFYNAVLEYCERRGYDKPNSQHDVTRKVNDEHGNIYLKQRTVDGERQRVWLGVRSLTDSTINHYFGADKEIKKQEEGTQQTIETQENEKGKNKSTPTVDNTTPKVSILSLIHI